MTEPSRLPIVKIAAGTAAVASTALLGYYLLRRSPRVSVSLTPLERAQQLKNEGNALFAKQQFDEAVKLFEESADILKQETMSPEQQQLLANVFNNLSAATECQGDLQKALDYTYMALTINKEYTKVYLRRARLYRKMNQLPKAFADTGYAMRLISDPKDKMFEKLNREFIEDLTKLSAEYVEAVFKSQFLSDQFLPISKLLVSDWTQRVSIHDPLLQLLDTVDTTGDPPEDQLDRALYLFKRGQFQEALEPAVEAAFDASADVRRVLLGRLMAARIYFFAGLYKQVEFVGQTFVQLWDAQSEEFKVQNRDLLLCYWSLRVFLDDVSINEQRLLQNKELLNGNVDPLVLLANHCSRWQDYEKASELIQLAKTLEPGHPDLDFHELIFNFYKAVKNQDMANLNTVATTIDRYITSNELNEFKVITVAKVFAALGNLDLSLEVMEKNKKNLEESVVFDLFYSLCYTEKNSNNSEVIKQFAEKMSALSKVDPENHEVLALLSRSLTENSKYFEASELSLRALRSVRFLQEFTIRYQDVLASFAFAGRELPLMELPPFEGPAYIKADSPDYAPRFDQTLPDVV